MIFYRCIFLCWFICLSLFVNASQQSDKRWHITQDGNIAWTIDDRLPHNDHIEMSGKRVSTVIRYGVDKDGAFTLNRGMVWPMLRTIPNDTHASLMRKLGWDVVRTITANGYSLDSEKVKEIRLNGLMTVTSEFKVKRGGSLELTRVLFPSVSLPAFCERYVLKNTGKKAQNVEIPQTESTVKTDPSKGVDGSYTLITKTTGSCTKLLQPGEEVVFGAYFIGYKSSEPKVDVNIEEEMAKRVALVAELRQNLILETPDRVLNTMFAFAKIRASESIYETKGGPLHGPGGESYYAAIWANDQAEYINPFFPFLGYDYGNKSALNAYRHFARFMNPAHKPIPSSIVAEGLDVWDGAGDRGDAAMIAYGAARYALARGDVKEALELWPLIEWCLEYCKRKVNSEGVVASDADELEGRLPAGKANLCTSSLYYDALLSASYLGRSLGKPAAQLSAYTKQAVKLRASIEKYFAGPVEGFNTYKYYKENTVLRSWICIPLTMGIYDRKQATVDALFSPRLWTNDGMLSKSGSDTIWDRSTLYALRGVYACGETEKANDYMTFYSAQRLLGEHVPYAIEAYPEGGQRHLSAESGLYCRIITEGMFGIRPTGLSSFSLTPRLPKAWDQMKLKRVNAFGHCFDVEVYRKGDGLEVRIAESGIERYRKIIKDGQSIDIVLNRLHKK